MKKAIFCLIGILFCSSAFAVNINKKVLLKVLCEVKGFEELSKKIDGDEPCPKFKKFMAREELLNMLGKKGVMIFEKSNEKDKKVLMIRIIDIDSQKKTKYILVANIKEEGDEKITFTVTRASEGVVPERVTRNFLPVMTMQLEHLINLLSGKNVLMRLPGVFDEATYLGQTEPHRFRLFADMDELDEEREESEENMQPPVNGTQTQSEEKDSIFGFKRGFLGGGKGLFDK